MKHGSGAIIPGNPALNLEMVKRPSLNSTLWTPANLSTAARAYYRFPDIGSLTLSGSNIEAIADQVNSYDLSQATSDNQPVTGTDTQNGLDLGTLDGINDYLSRSDALGFTGNPAITVAIFMNLASGQTGADEGFQIGSSNATQGEIIRVCPTDNSFRYNNGNRVFDGVTDGLHCWIFQRDAGDTYADGALYLDGTLRSEVSVSGGTNTPNLSDQDCVLGGKRNVGGAIGGTLQGAFAFVLAIPAVLSTAERQNLEGWGMNELGAASTLFSGHPYEFSPPTV